ncbi:hypothetical protein KFE25_001399 [Diacronema lutheri]|uniref:Phosphoglycerate mutase n=2 Tax=Diacronema lutheri TaxID=2081491 RepID=A0A8J6C8C1_DIALT|nr:hypothetical protein KFE25_001399 [Diacronema lutheri]
MGAVRVRLIDPASAVRYEVTVDPVYAALWLVLACVLAFAFELLLSPAKRTARAALREKVELLLSGVAHMALSRDKSFKLSKQPDAQLLELMTEPSQTKRVILIRHGESLWNAVFNKSPMLLMPLRLARALVYEALVLLELDSVLFDSPLSAEGRAQARELADFLARAHAKPSLAGGGAEQADIAALFDTTGSSVVVCSMLRRAISTAWLALEERLRAAPPSQPMYLHSALQEMSRNVDTLSIAPPRTMPPLSRVNGDAACVPDLSAHTSARHHTGNKPVRAVALTRIGHFAEWLFARAEPCVVVVGHSLLFRTLFQLYLPRASAHDAKAKKVVNCGVVGLTLHKGTLPDGRISYRIDPQSVTVLYGGFGGK